MNESCKNVVNGGERLHTPHKKIDTKFHGFFFIKITHTYTHVIAQKGITSFEIAQIHYVFNEIQQKLINIQLVWFW
jgi:hypothetical protein